MHSYYIWSPRRTELEGEIESSFCKIIFWWDYLKLSVMHISFLIPESVRVFFWICFFVSQKVSKCSGSGMQHKWIRYSTSGHLLNSLKFLKKKVAQQLMKHVELNSCLHPLQFDFCLLYRDRFFVEQIKSSFDIGGVVGIVFLDLKKASYTSNHDILVNCPAKLNFSVNSPVVGLNLIQSWKIIFSRDHSKRPTTFCPWSTST